MSWLARYGYSDCVFCDIIAHQPWEPASFVYEDDDVAVFHNILGWIPVMLLAVPRGRVPAGSNGAARHYEQRDLWRGMGRLGAVAMAMGRAHCSFNGSACFRLVCNLGSLALQTQSHAHLHVLGTRFEPTYPDLRRKENLVFQDERLIAYSARLDATVQRRGLSALMIVPRERLDQDGFFARMDDFGAAIIDIADRFAGASYRLLAEIGPHAPIAGDGAHIFVLSGGSLGHYV